MVEKNFEHLSSRSTDELAWYLYFPMEFAPLTSEVGVLKLTL